MKDVLGLVSLYRDPLQWGGASFPSYEGRCEDAPAGGSATAGGGSSSGSTAAPPTAPTATAGSSPAGSAAASPAAVDWKTAPEQFRSSYEALKTEHEAYKALGLPPEAIKSQVEKFTAYQNLAHQFGEVLGFTKEQVNQHFAQRPLETLAYLRQKYQEAVAARGGNSNGGNNGQEDPVEAIKQELMGEVAPLKQFVAQQVTQAAIGLFNTEFDRLIDTNFKDADLDQDERDFLYKTTTEMMKYDRDAMTRLRNDQKVSDVEKYFKQAQELYLKLQQRFEARTTKRLGNQPKGGNQNGQQGNQPAFTLDDIISGNDKAVAAIPSMRS